MRGAAHGGRVGHGLDRFHRIDNDGADAAIARSVHTLGALLSEVRALRTTIEAVASATASGQLTLGRLQL